MSKFLKINNYYPHLKNPNKYIGKKKIITIRSSYELLFIKKHLDENPNCLFWSSEDWVVQYLINGQKKNYIIDFYVKTVNNEYLIEVKPKKDTIKPILGKNGNMNSFKYSQITYIVNQLKWQSAKQLCENINTKHKDVNRNIQFKVITEEDL